MRGRLLCGRRKGRRRRRWPPPVALCGIRRTLLLLLLMLLLLRIAPSSACGMTCLEHSWRSLLMLVLMRLWSPSSALVSNRGGGKRLCHLLHCAAVAVAVVAVDTCDAAAVAMVLSMLGRSGSPLRALTGLKARRRSKDWIAGIAR